MTENKRFTLEEFGLNFIVNDNGRNLTAKQTVDRLNDLNDENEHLKKENKELRQDNDIKFWKHQFMIQHNRTQLILHELSLAMNEGYEVSDKFKQYLDEIKEHNKEIREKHKRLFE